MSAPPSRAPGSAHRATNPSGAQLGITLTSLVVGFLAGPSPSVLLTQGLGLRLTGLSQVAATGIATTAAFVVAGFVAESDREGLLDEDEITLLTGALNFEHLTAQDVAIPGEQLRTVPHAVTVAELEEICAQTGFSGFPVRAEDGMLVGYVHTKGLLGAPAERRHAPLPEEALRRLATVGADVKLRHVMRSMQERNAHLALVEGRGTTAGDVSVVALEDVLEELVGEVRDATSATR